jgi:hypothetical protein
MVSKALVSSAGAFLFEKPPLFILGESLTKLPHSESFDQLFSLLLIWLPPAVYDAAQVAVVDVHLLRRRHLGSVFLQNRKLPL